MLSLVLLQWFFYYSYLAPATGPVSDNQNRNIGIGVGVGVGGFLLIVIVVIVIAVLIFGLKKRNTEKYVLNYSTVYGKSVLLHGYVP